MTSRDQPQQHGVGGVANPPLDAFRRRFVRNPEVSKLTPFGFFQAGWSESGQEIDRLRAQVASLREHQRYVGGVYADLMNSHEALEARCASLEAALRKVHAVDSDWHRRIDPTCSVCATLDQHTTTTTSSAESGDAAMG